MWEFLKGLPVAVSVSLLFMAIIAIVVVALRGRIKAIFGDKNIEIGPTSSEKPKTVEIPQTLPPTVIIQKRSCGDCILLLMGEREKFEIQIKQETNRILKSQMNFTEQKLIEIQNIIMKDIIEVIRKFNLKNSNAVDEVVQYKLVYGLFRDALLNIKDEMRRSFKDNGFYDLSGSEFMAFTRDRTAIVHSILDQYVRNIFPDHAGVISPQDVIDVFEKEREFIGATFNDIYTYARNIRAEAHNNINMFMADFKKWIDEFIHPKEKQNGRND